jgi:myo-inositol-1(or 4)-monophosphatase
MDEVIEIMKKAAESANEAIVKTSSELMWRQKEPKELVTNCDIASENAIVEILKKEYPKSKIYSEEVGEITGEEEMLWILDPIDGTHNFIHKLPYYAISIGLYKKGKPFAGLIYIPKLNECYYAIKGEGAFLNDNKITVSDIKTLSNSMVTYDNQFHKHEAMLKNLPILQEKCFTLRIFGSAAVDLCNIAQGAIESRIFHKTKLVDFAAGIVIVEEAGGKVTNFNGEEPTPKTKDIIASNGSIHQELLETLEL